MKEIGLFEIVIYQFHMQRSLKNEGESFKLHLDLYLILLVIRDTELNPET